jgi:4-diphosphocytidyl-2-C-methyl-D-erythritol kinase
MLTLKAKAKVNLFLHILGKLPNNYHELQSLVVFANIYDTLNFELTNKKEHSLIINGEFAIFLDASDNNLIIKALKYFEKNYNMQQKISITLEKNLPLGGGIGGGSSNCAMTIMAINQLLGFNFEKEKLQEIALNFGADVPVCLGQASCFFSGIGEKLTPYNHLPKNMAILLVNPKEPLETKAVFSAYSQNYSAPLDLTLTTDFIPFIKQQRNDLEESAKKLNHSIDNILLEIAKTNPIITRMTGSGSTCFGLYHSLEEATLAQKKLAKIFPGYWVKSAKIQ